MRFLSRSFRVFPRQLFCTVLEQFAKVNDDELWRLRCGFSELPAAFSTWFAYARRQTMREQALDHLYGRSGVTQNWRKGLQLVSVLVDAGDDYAMALYGWALWSHVGIDANQIQGINLLKQSKHFLARAFCLLEVFVPREVNHNEAYHLLNTEHGFASDPHVQYLLGRCLERGWGCAKNTPEAMQCFKRAGNHLCALHRLGCILLNAEGRRHDPDRADRFIRRTNEQGFPFVWIYEYKTNVTREQVERFLQMYDDE